MSSLIPEASRSSGWTAKLLIHPKMLSFLHFFHKNAQSQYIARLGGFGLPEQV